MKALISFFILMIALPLWAKDTISFDHQESFLNLKSGKLESLSLNQKYKVFIFLSKDCPCSAANLPLINDYALEFPMFEFIGVHAMKDITPKELESFNIKDLSFPIYNDPSLIITKKFEALKTPHTFILSPAGEILYKGGVANSVMPKNAKIFYLKNALLELQAQKSISIKESKTLGCYIER